MRAVWALLIIFTLASCASNTNLVGQATCNGNPWPCPPTPPSPPDIGSNTLPTITNFQATPSTATASATITLSADVNDVDGGTLTTRFFQNGNEIHSTTSSNPTHSVELTSPGDYTFYASVSDGDASVNSGSTTVTITAGNSAPVVNSFDVQSSSQTNPSSITFTASVSDVDGGTLTTRFFKGADQLHETTGPNPSYQYDENTPGTYTYSMLVTDGSLDTTQSFEAITIDRQNSAPRVTGVQINPSSPTAPSTLHIAVFAEDDDEDELEVSIRVNGELQSDVERVDPYNFTYQATTAGTYVVTGIASDDRAQDSGQNQVTIGMAQVAPDVSLDVTATSNDPGTVAQISVDSSDDNPGDTVTTTLILEFTPEGGQTQMLSSETVDTPYQTSYTMNNLGTYRWIAIADDGQDTQQETREKIISTIPNQAPQGSQISTDSSSSTPPSDIITTVTVVDDDPAGALVRFYLNGKQEFEVSQPPFEHTYTVNSAGEYIVTAQVEDSGGLTEDLTGPVQIIDSVTNGAPELTLKVTANSSTVPVTVNVIYNITDPDFDLTNFSLYQDDILVEKVPQKNGVYSVNLTEAGTYTYRGVVEDPAGNNASTTKDITFGAPQQDDESSNDDDDDDDRGSSSSGGSGGSSSGGGGFYRPPPCQPDIVCEDWNSCTAGEQSRKCFDQNQCESDETQTRACVKSIKTTLEAEGLDKQLTLYESEGVFQGDLSGIADGEFFTLTLSEDQSETLLVEDIGSREQYELYRKAPNVYSNEPPQQITEPEPEPLANTPFANADEKTKRDYTVFFILAGILILGAFGAIETRHLVIVRKQDKKLLDYIRTYKYAGKIRLRELLLSSGWSEKRVNKLLDKEFTANKESENPLPDQIK